MGLPRFGYECYLFSMSEYDHRAIEKKWRDAWAQDRVYVADESSSKPKKYVLDMFPYPSGEGLHVGHPKGYIATDVYARMHRMQGYEVLHPMGWDAFGLPAENYAIKNKMHPRIATDKNIQRYKTQLESIGFDYDWSREINTTDPNYYKWTQWIFLKLFERGLAYQSHEPVNWCPSCKTGLSNEDLDGGKCERCGSEVEQRPLRQWVLKITDYADRLLDDLELLPEWQPHIKEMQRNWIGRSEGAEIDFAIEGREEKITVFTTRPDTLYGVTYMVLAPEHPLVGMVEDQITNRDELAAYVDAARHKTELERQEGKEKTGVEIHGIRAVNPVNGESIPVYIADYVLAHYGTGAIMAVPAHDERDYAFAKKFGLPMREVVVPDRTDANNPPREGLTTVPRRTVQCIVRRPHDGKILVLDWKELKWKTLIIGGVEMGEDLIEAATREIYEETGYKNVTFKKNLGDMYANYCAIHKGENRRSHAVGLLFDLDNEECDEISDEEKAKHAPEWVTVEEALHSVIGVEPPVYLRRLDQDTWLYQDAGTLVNSGEYDGSDSETAKQKIVEKVGGRMTKTYRLKDWVFSRQRYWGEPIPIVHCAKCGAVPVPENQLPVVLPEVESYEPTGTGESPLAAIAEWVNTACPLCGGAATRETNTMPQWAGSCWYYLRYMDPHNDTALVDARKETYWAPVDMYVGGAEHATRHLIYARFWHKFLHDIGVVSTPEPFTRLVSVGLIMAEDGRKMSKRYGNVVNPDDMVALYGADTLRVYEMFMGPFADAIAWSTENMIGSRRFIERLWRLGGKLAPTTPDVVVRELHKTIQKVSEDIPEFKFNTAIAQLMILLNTAEKHGVAEAEYRTMLILLAPFAPHVSEELWHAHGGEGYIVTAPWPTYDPALLIADTATIAVQINGKVRTTIEVAVDAPESEVLTQAKNAAAKWLEGSTITKEIYVPGRIVSIAISH